MKCGTRDRRCEGGKVKGLGKLKAERSKGVTGSQFRGHGCFLTLNSEL